MKKFHLGLIGMAVLVAIGALILVPRWVFPAPQASTTTQAIPTATLVPIPVGEIVTGGKMNMDRACHSATLLSSGMVLVAGGIDSNEDLLKSAELYDPVKRTFTPTGDMLTARACHRAVQMPGGRILIVGGTYGKGADVEIYDPSTGRFEPAGRPLVEGGGSTATLLGNGKVLMTGGLTKQGFTGAQLYDPISKTFTLTGSMAVTREIYTATRLADGKVLFFGGNLDGPGPQAEIYDPATGTFSPTKGQPLVRRHKHEALLLSDGNVLLMGGSNHNDWRGQYTSAELYNAATGTFTAVGSMNSERFKIADTAVLLKNGQVFVGGAAIRPEVYDPAGRNFSQVSGQLDTPRYSSTATLLSDGSVLIIGGYDSNIQSTIQTWIYRP